MIQSPDVLHHIQAESHLKAAHSAFLHGDISVAKSHMKTVIDASLKFLKELHRYEAEISSDQARGGNHEL